MTSESDGALLSRFAVDLEDPEFTNDDCGLCPCETDCGPKNWTSSDCPGRPGDILQFDRGTYLHYGVMVDAENVVHMTGDGPVRWTNIASSASKNAVIKKEPFSKVARGAQKVQIWNKYDDRYSPFPAHMIARRAMNNTGRRGYHLLVLNCEHFSNWCRYGVSMSHQAELLGTAAAAATGAAIGSLAGPVGAVLGLLGGIVLSTGSTLLRHRTEYEKVRALKRSVSTAQMPSVLLSQHSIQSERRNSHDRLAQNGHDRPVQIGYGKPLQNGHDSAEQSRHSMSLRNGHRKSNGLQNGTHEAVQ